MKADARTNITTRKRIIFLLMIIFLLQTAIVGRYAWIQIVWSPQLQRWATDQWTSETRIEARRGQILDRNNNPLAISGNVARVDAHLKDVNKAENSKTKKVTKEETAEKLAQILGTTKEDILAKLNKTLPNGLPMANVSIARRIEREEADKIRELKLPGIVVTEDTKRYYPKENLLSQVLGSTDVDGNGRSGLERRYDSELKGRPGSFVAETDAYHRELPYSVASYNPPKNGNNLVLNIDESIQYFSEKAIERGLIDYKAKQISILVMDPKTGEVLAMANKPDFDPNNPVKGTVKESQDRWRNRAVNDVFEPGSVLKVITAAAAIEENVVKDSDRFVCNGSHVVADRRIKCWRTAGHGTQTFAQILQNSCNVGFMMLGDKLQKERLYKYFNAFGLGKKTNIDLPGEEVGLIRPIEKVGPVELANEAFGQGIAVTPIQFLTAFASVANDGKMMEPHVVKKVVYVDENGQPYSEKLIQPKVVKQTISPESAKKLREMLESVVSVGAGKKAYVEGYHVGGKTGTAQKVENGVYAKAKYISSFVGMVPATDPRFVLLVSIDEPDPSNYYAGSTAAPLAKTLIEDIVRYLNMEPDSKPQDDNALPEVVIPEIRGMSSDEAQALIKKNKLNFEVQGNGSIIYDVSPKPGMMVKQNTKITIYLSNNKNTETKVAVPSFMGMTRKEISELASSLGIQVNITGEGIGASQDISAGSEVEKNTTVRVILEPPED